MHSVLSGAFRGAPNGTNYGSSIWTTYGTDYQYSIVSRMDCVVCGLQYGPASPARNTHNISIKALPGIIEPYSGTILEQPCEHTI